MIMKNITVDKTATARDIIGRTLCAIRAACAGWPGARVLIVIACLLAVSPFAYAEVSPAYEWDFSKDALCQVTGAPLSLNGNAAISGGELDLGGGGTRVNNATFPAEVGNTISNATAVTIEAWFNQDAQNGYRKLIMLGQDNGVDSTFIEITPHRGPYPTSGLAMGIDDNTSAELGLIPGYNLTSGTKYYVAATWDTENDLMTLRYGPVGGSLSTNTLSMGGRLLSNISYTELYIGSAVHFPDPDFDGQVDHMRIYNVALDDSQAAANFAAGPDAEDTTAELLHGYAFTGNVEDYIGSADLTLNGSATVGAEELDLPGGGTRMHNATFPSIVGEELAAMNSASWVAWFNQDTAQDWSKVAMFGAGTDDYIDITPRRGADGNVSSASINDNSHIEFPVKSSAAALSTGTKYFIAAVWDGENDTVTIHVAPVGGSITSTSATMGGNKLYNINYTERYLGSAVGFNDSDFDGQMDEFRIYTGALSTAEVSQILSEGPKIFRGTVISIQ